MPLLHLTIVNSGGAWTASELFTTDDLGFGTYQWQVDGPIDVYDKNVVLGLFVYGPTDLGPDGTHEIGDCHAIFQRILTRNLDLAIDMHHLGGSVLV